MQSSGGHCSGIGWTLQQLEAGDLPYNRFTSGATAPSELADHTGPKNGLGSFLDSQHGGQTSAEFLDFYFDRSDSLAGQLQTIQSELANGRQPAISVKNGFSEGHVMTAYDTAAAPDGGAYIYVYDNNHPWVPRDTGPDGSGEERNELKSVGTHHLWEIARGRIHIDAARQTWTFDDLGWSGGGGELFVVPYGVIPDDPTLPLSLDPTTWLNLIIVFGASNGSAVSSGIDGADSADFLPARRGGHAWKRHTHRPRRRGHRPSDQWHAGWRLPRRPARAGVRGIPAHVHTDEGIEDSVRYNADAVQYELQGRAGQAAQRSSRRARRRRRHTHRRSGDEHVRWPVAMRSTWPAVRAGLSTPTMAARLGSP